MTNVIELSNVSFCWQKNQPPTIEIPKLVIEQGEHLFLKGPSGSGKSTLLSLLTGINTADSGEVKALGQSLTELPSRHRDRFRADHIGYIFQQFNLIPYLSVIDNVTLPCEFSQHRRNKVSGTLQDEAKHLLQQLHLDSQLWMKPVVELSIGQQQRVAAARALIGQPEILIADEPTSALDHDNREAFITLLMEQANQANSTMVFVSHDPSLEPLFSRSANLTVLNQARSS
ncbi:ABC transporter ATP-binding protein [Vibrio methylphosphonaticus]|uniref:ABC transporter ATP-binding protein n=1 Tax=Vibrio methylphosphonaticus TaxID=2946866 RepID=UPI00202A8CAD|nr:ABC transporter ATP-binding protein [Vibrio methylphosphonaticus]MCL9777088.1 ABC transporter ATP-binding protein [Vibrio methylphosphonaticus]